MTEQAFRMRVATLADADAVTALLTASYEELITFPEGSPGWAAASIVMPLMCRSNPDLLESGRYYVADAVEGGPLAGLGLVGCGGWSTDAPRGTPDSDAFVSGKTGHIRHVATHPDALGHGIGRAIIDRCFADAVAIGVTDWHVTATWNAIGFYQSCGFGEARELILDFPRPDGNGAIKLPSWQMTRP